MHEGTHFEVGCPGCNGTGKVKVKRSLVLDTKDVMIKLPGSSKPFRCECGCNVFREYIDSYVIKCNACPREYEGEVNPVNKQ